MRVARKGTLALAAFAALVTLGCSSTGPLPMADAGRPAWRGDSGEIEAVLATDHLLLRFTRDEGGRVASVLGIEGPFEGDPAGKMPRDFFSIRGVGGSGRADLSPWPLGGRLAWAHSFAYDANGHLQAEIDCLGGVTPFKPGSEAKIDPERGTALPKHAHRGEGPVRGGSATDAVVGYVDRLRTDPDPLWRIFEVKVGPHTYVLDAGGVRTQSRR